MNLFDLHYDVRWMAYGDLAGKTFYEILRGTPITTPLFQRAIADADYLPFPDGSFDYIVLRAVAHHLFDLKRFMCEANRVLKPGGQLLLLSEPLASVLDRPAEYSEGDLDYEEGMHETRPYFYKYRSALRVANFTELEVQCYFIGLGFRLNRWMNRLRLPGDLNAWLPRRLVRGPLTRLLNFTAGCMNLYATKRSNCPSLRFATELPDAKPPVPLAWLMASMYADPGESGHIVREFVPTLLPSIELTESGTNRLLVRGHRKPEMIAGKSGSYLLSTFSVYISAGKRTVESLNFEFNADELAGNSAHIHINGQQVDFTFQNGGWKTGTIALPKSKEAVPVYEMRIEQPDMIHAERTTAQPRDIGLALRRVWLS